LFWVFANRAKARFHNFSVWKGGLAIMRESTSIPGDHARLSVFMSAESWHLPSMFI
jgi:hypothetical protein